MLKQQASLYRKLMIAADVAIAGGAFYLAYQLRDLYIEKLYPIEDYLWVLPATMTLWGVLLYFSEMYTSFRLKPLGEIVWIILKTAFFGFLIFSCVIFSLKLTYVSRFFILMIFVLTTFFILVEKIILIQFFRYFRKKGLNFRNILVVGSGPRAQRFIASADRHRELGLKIVGVVDDDFEDRPPEVLGHRVIGSIKDIPMIVRESAIDIVVFIVPRNWLDRIEEPILYCETVGIAVSLAVDIFELKFTTGKESQLFGFPLLTFERTPQKAGELLLKRMTDIVLASVALILISPLILLIALVIKSTSRGPVFFKQKRCGLNGRRFILYKFRTMENDAEARLESLKRHNVMEGPVFKMENDPRVTKAGKILRKLSLDELPQLWNVLKGEMSLVGPRPPLVKEVAQYDHWQRRRLSMRPGITCIWQISGRNEIVDFNRWMKMDMEYIDQWSIWLDFQIMAKTIPAVLIARGAK